MKVYLIKDSQGLTDWFTKVHGMGEDFYPITIQVFKGEKKHRELSQNDLSHVWYREISKQSNDRTFEEVKREAKLTCGVPILRADSEEFRGMYDKVVKGHAYETKLKMMDYLPVTSLMTVKQMSEYLEQMYYKYSDAGYFLARNHGSK